eukprot:8685945-Ditylum_brightwellii.AAC.1
MGNQEIEVLEWVEVLWKGITNGKQNIQLELGYQQYPVSEVITKLENQLNICRLHQAEYKWKHWTLKCDLNMSHADTHCVFCTNFATTLDLRATKTDNCNMDNHGIICILFVLTNWREVQYEKETREIGEMALNDCNE